MIPRRLLPNKVVIEERAGSDPWGGTAYSEPYEVRSLTESKRRVVRNDKGAEVTSSTTVYIDSRHIPEASRVTIWPDKPTSSQSDVITVEQYEAGRLSHTVLYLE